MTYITPPPRQTTPLADQIADRIIHRVNAQLAELVHQQKAGYAEFWDASETPDAIIAGMRTNAAKAIGAASRVIDLIADLAPLLGTSLAEALPAEHWMPRREIIFAGDGSATLAPPADGFDAWGRLIPVPEPEPVEENE
jgi:hypothetical protein